MPFRTGVVLMAALALLGCSRKKPETNSRARANDTGTLERFQQQGKFGFRDAAGDVVIRPEYAEAGNFSWGLVRVKPEAKGNWGYIDATGETVIPPQFEGAGDFVDGIAVVLSKGKLTYIGPDGESLGLFNDDRPGKPLVVGDTLYVIHPSGLIARASGDAHAAPMGTVRPGEPVQYLYDPHASRSETVDGLRGTWRLVKYQRKSGYLFDLYLSRYPLAEERQPAERYHVVTSELKTADYSTYDLTKFASGGRLVVHHGPNWTDTQEIIRAANVDQVIARLKLYPAGDIGTLIGHFNGSSGTSVTETGDTVVVIVRRDRTGFLDHVSISRKNEESTFDVSVSNYGVDAVEVAATLTVEAESQDDDQQYEF